MLQIFFFVLTFATDYHAVTDAFRSELLLGLIDACVVCVTVTWLSIRSRMMVGNRQTFSRSGVD